MQTSLASMYSAACKDYRHVLRSIAVHFHHRKHIVPISRHIAYGGIKTLFTCWHYYNCTDSNFHAAVRNSSAYHFSEPASVCFFTRRCHCSCVWLMMSSANFYIHQTSSKSTSISTQYWEITAHFWSLPWLMIHIQHVTNVA